MKKALQSIALFGAFLTLGHVAQAQRSIPVEVTITSPLSGSSIDYNDSTEFSINIKNISTSENLVAGDTLFLIIPALQSGGSGFILNNGLNAGADLEYKFNITHSIDTDTNIDLSLCVYAYGTNDLDPNIPGSWTNPLFGTGDCVNITLNSESNVDEEDSTSVLNIITVSSLDIYPNPALSDLFINMDMERAEDVTVSVKDITGREVFNKQYSQLRISKNAPLAISLQQLTAGMYVIEVTTNSQKAVGKVTLK